MTLYDEDKFVLYSLGTASKDKKESNTLRVGVTHLKNAFVWNTLFPDNTSENQGITVSQSFAFHVLLK